MARAGRGVAVAAEREGRAAGTAAERERVAHVRPYRFAVDEFARMGEAGIFTEDDRVELIDGAVLEMTPIGPPHAGIVGRLTELLVTRLAGRAYVSVQNPIRLDRHTEPRPDLVVARRRQSGYTDRHPDADDVLLVVEVAPIRPCGTTGSRRRPATARRGFPRRGWWILRPGPSPCIPVRGRTAMRARRCGAGGTDSGALFAARPAGKTAARPARETAARRTAGRRSTCGSTRCSADGPAADGGTRAHIDPRRFRVGGTPADGAAAAGWRAA